MKTAVWAAGLVLVVAPPTYAKSTVAQRFDSVVRVEIGGTVEVTETLVFRFEGGPFTELLRDVRVRNSDGIEILDASMDGDPIQFGEGAGQARVEGKARDRIRWRFAPISDSTHTFVVRYLVRAAVRQDDRGDLLVWRTPGSEHRWPIESATIDYELPSGVGGTVSTTTHRTERTSWSSGAFFRVRASGIRSNGWVEATLAMPTGSILSAPPAWQEAQRQRATYARYWLGAGTLVFVGGLIVLFGLRQGYEPPRHLQPGIAGDTPPDSLPPALAGILSSRGRPSLEHAAATLLTLADGGHLRVQESDRHTLGSRTYYFSHSATHAQLTPSEEAVLAAAFGNGRDSSVTLAKARTRLVRRFGRFAQAALSELDAAGLLDHNRQKARRAFLRLMMAEFVLALAALAAWPLLMSAHGAWPVALFVGLAAAGIVTLIFYGTMTTPLTNEGVQRGRHWRAYRDHLKNVSRNSGRIPAVSLAYPVALGLAGQWSKHFKRHPSAPPAWFQSSGGSSAYAAFIAAAGAGAHGNSPPHHAH
jgi:hypothetical protein